jgi:hypothetical protein
MEMIYKTGGIRMQKISNLKDKYRMVSADLFIPEFSPDSARGTCALIAAANPARIVAQNSHKKLSGFQDCVLS